jgi:hypothetical protein
MVFEQRGSTLFHNPSDIRPWKMIAQRTKHWHRQNAVADRAGAANQNSRVGKHKKVI